MVLGRATRRRQPSCARSDCRRLGLEQIFEIFQTREAIEGMAARLACRRGGKAFHSTLREIKKKIAKANIESDPMLGIALGRELHRATMDAAHNSIMADIKHHAPTATVLVVSNPVDVLTYRAWRVSGQGRDKVFGQAGVLDTARMKCFIAEETGFSARDITALVLGGHGDSMVPLMRYCQVGSVPLSHFLSSEQIERIVERTRKGGGEILGLKKTGSACDAPGVAIAHMVDAIANGRNRILPAVAILEGEYGRTDIAMGVPCVLAEKGLARIIELPLDAQEQAMFDHSADQVLRDIAEMNAL